MSRFAIQLTRSAAKDLDTLPHADRDQLLQDLGELALTPVGRPPRIKRLRGFSFPLYRLRSRDYRVLYRVDETQVTVMRIVNRRDLERIVRRLK